MYKKLAMNIDVNVLDRFAIIGVMYTQNGCCKDKPYLLTVNRTSKTKERPDGLNYSCQCACNGWCTNGHTTPAAAIAEYEQMTEKYLASEEGRRHYAAQTEAAVG